MLTRTQKVVWNGAEISAGLFEEKCGLGASKKWKRSLRWVPWGDAVG
jgi:hypothetical protein